MAGHLITASPAPPSTAASDLKRRVLDCLSRLADRDTQPQAAAELETTAVTINLRSVASFISWIRPPEDSKSAVRATSLRLLSVLSRHHGGALVYVLPKMLAAVTRRLRDGDSATRAACVEAISAMATNIEAPFSIFSKPVAAALFSEQDSGAQAGAALCLAAAVDGSAFKDLPALRRLLLKLVKLLSSDGFKAKPALLALIGSVIESGGASSNLMVKEATERMMDCVGSREWATRKAAAGALAILAVAERDILPEFKASCLKVLEDRKYDKVKAVREAMNDLVEKWKEIPDVSYEASPPPFSPSSCRETVNNGGCIPCVDSHSKWRSNSRRFSMPSGSLSGICKETGAVKHSSPSRGVGSIGRTPVSRPEGRAGRDESDGHTQPGGGQAVFIRTSDSCSPPSQEGILESVESYNSPPKRAHDLESIGKQLVHIEHQQSCLLELLQKVVVVGASEGGMCALERRVCRLELMLEKILSDPSAAGSLHVSDEELPPTCCVLPGTDFFSSRFRARLSGGRNPSGPLQTTTGESKQRGGSPGKLIVNPLA